MNIKNYMQLKSCARTNVLTKTAKVQLCHQYLSLVILDISEITKSTKTKVLLHKMDDNYQLVIQLTDDKYDAHCEDNTRLTI